MAPAGCLWTNQPPLIASMGRFEYNDNSDSSWGGRCKHCGDISSIWGKICFCSFTGNFGTALILPTSSTWCNRLKGARGKLFFIFYGQFGWSSIKHPFKVLAVFQTVSSDGFPRRFCDTTHSSSEVICSPLVTSHFYWRVQMENILSQLFIKDTVSKPLICQVKIQKLILN